MYSLYCVLNYIQRHFNYRHYDYFICITNIYNILITFRNYTYVNDYK